MFNNVFKKVFGSRNDRLIKQYFQTVGVINKLEIKIAELTDAELRAKTDEFRQRIKDGETLDMLLPEAFAVVREASKRVLGMRHFGVQLIGGMVLHSGKIAEMRTGEGKTLMATLPSYLNALDGKGFHLVTVNDYLAKRDSEWMGRIYQFLGLSVGVVVSDMEHEQRQAAYSADITYGTNNEFGFDYLRDNMAFSAEERVQRRMNFAIVDEVDSILIDEARTPLIISGGLENTADVYKAINGIVPGLVEQVKTPEDIEEEREPPGDYFVDEKQRDVELTEEGHQKIENLLVRKGLLAEGESLYGTANLTLFHHVSASLKAHKLYKSDVDYIVAEGEIVIVDEHTGRTMPGRRWSGGIHQAIEAKENVNITNESQTLASTTFQNYFRLYKKLAGMTGTADTEAFEFRQIYGLDVVVIPTNLPMVRRDLNDLIFMSHAEKFEAIADEIADCLANNAPVLVGTASIETSELLSELLNKKKVKHSVLNAKFHEKEAEIIAQAGRPGTVTIATNMAGRGTDIILGGSWEAEVARLEAPTPDQVEKIKVAWQESHDQVLEAGGLHVIGTERHESRRIDNQLRGRAGRQGDPGYSRFYLSLEDDLMRIFASDRVRGFMQNMGMENGEAIEHKMVTNAIEKAQRKVEGRNFDIRKQLLEYDDVANDQRQMIYGQRNELIESEEISHIVDALWDDVIDEVIDGYIPPQSLEEQWDVPGLESACHTEFNVKLPVQNWLDEDSSLFEDTLRQRIVGEIRAEYVKKEALVGPQLRMFEKRIMLDILDGLWKEHLAAMDYLRQGIHLRAYAQKKPKDEYKREAFDLFDNLLRSVRFDVIRFLSRVQFQSEEDAEALELRRREEESRVQKNYQKDGSPGMDGAAVKTPADELNEPFVRPDKKVGRNEPCPCGSGKKYKSCHGKLG